MKFFLGKSKKRNRQEERIVNCSEIFVAKTTVYSSFLDPHGGGPLTLEKYFLVTEKDGKYFELLSGVELKKESDIHSNGFAVSFKNTPYIENITPLVQYLRDETLKTLLKTLSYENLFDSITTINVELILSSKKE